MTRRRALVAFALAVTAPTVWAACTDRDDAADPGSAAAQGNSNVTNGCINLSPADAEQYFRSALYGDPVEVTGTSIPLSQADGDIWDWTVPWADWLAMSALNGPRPGR